jgi:hypothetical protein
MNVVIVNEQLCWLDDIMPGISNRFDVKTMGYFQGLT